MKHICVCICTFKRPRLLLQLLEGLERQRTEELFNYSIVVADNDSAQSARAVVLEFAARAAINTKYCVEPRQNIALARNKALGNSYGDFIAFIDDDEIPTDDWLRNLFKACVAQCVDGVLGPVMPLFENEPPDWVTKGCFFERPIHESGHKIDLSDARTGNLLFRRKLLDDEMSPFREEFGTGGEDVDFFRRMLAKGAVFVWCNEAIVYETVPLSRCTRNYQLRRALLRGNISLKYGGGGAHMILKSLLAVPAYGIALPFSIVMGDHFFMKYMVKFCDHAGRLLALLKLNPVRERNL